MCCCRIKGRVNFSSTKTANAVNRVLLVHKWVLSFQQSSDNTRSPLTAASSYGKQFYAVIRKLRSAIQPSA